jgi:hypothetical protein
LLFYRRRKAWFAWIQKEVEQCMLVVSELERRQMGTKKGVWKAGSDAMLGQLHCARPQVGDVKQHKLNPRNTLP